MSETDEFEKALMGRLTAAPNDKEFLRSTSSAIVSLKKMGLVIDGVNVKGKPGFVDRIFINGTPRPDFWRNFNNFQNIGHLRSFELFPYGILNPEGMKFKATFEL